MIASAYHLSDILLADFNLDVRLPEIQTPTLIVGGADDWVAPMSQAVRMQHERPNDTTLVFEESGRYPFIEEHDAFTSSLAAWLRQVSQAKSPGRLVWPRVEAVLTTGASSE